MPRLYQGNLNHLTALRERRMTAITTKHRNDPDIHKGAIEGDRATDEQIGNPHGLGIDEDGMPNDPIATAQDELGANEDESQG